MLDDLGHPVQQASLEDEANAVAGSNLINGPLFILAAPRSFTSVVCTMLGQHPQMYGLPEMHLFSAETMIERRVVWSRSTFNRNHGILRVVAQLYFGMQTQDTIKLARGWLRRRVHFTTGFLLEVLAQKVHPRILVDKSPSSIRRLEFLERAYSMFPQAKFLHLVRHPRGHGESLMMYLQRRARPDRVPPSGRLARYSGSSVRPANWDWIAHFDPQRNWYALNVNICKFLESVPDEQKMRIRGEDVILDPDQRLREVASWMGLRTDAEAIEEMKHPERSPYACFGPAGARGGNDPDFLESPTLRPQKGKPHSLEGPLSWRIDRGGFLPRVKRLAKQFGYE
jgi:hypothetical protein